MFKKRALSLGLKDIFITFDFENLTQDIKTKKIIERKI